MSLFNLIFGLAILVVVGYFLAKIVRTHFYFKRVESLNQAKFDRINALLRSDDPEQVKQGQQEYLQHLSRGPYR
jgi:hypothetical protein